MDKICISIGTVDIDDLDSLLDWMKENVRDRVLQVLNAEHIVSVSQIEFAFMEALDAMQEKNNIANSLNNEFLLRLAGVRQVDKAIANFGIKKGKNKAIIVVSGNDCKKVMEELISKFYFIVDDFVLDIDDKRFNSLKKFYQIEDKQINLVGGKKEDALTNLVLEKVATLEL
ncbi:MAG: hypothetical protein JXA43_03150 [Candidatus Diapherotrites archaeon]|nr:hypothetical protein [Candidatus Diapherotrites archaeon]